MYGGTPQGDPREESQQVDHLRRRQDETSTVSPPDTHG